MQLASLLLTIFSSSLAMASLSPEMDTSPKPNVLAPRAPTLTAECDIYGAARGSVGIADGSWFIEITLTGTWGDVSGLQSTLNTKLGSTNVIQFTSKAASGPNTVNFYSPSIQGGNIVHWDSQLSDSIYSFSGNTVRVTCAYPGL